MRHGKRLCDVQERQPVLGGTGKVVFFAPHSSERMATLPFISEVSAKLHQAGRECGTHSIEDMKDSVIFLSARILRLKLSKKELGGLDALFRMKDAAIRLSLLCSILKGNPGASVLEVHALGRDYSGKDSFPHADCFFRLPGTRVLYRKDVRGEYEAPIGTGLDVLGMMDARLKAAATMLSLDEARMREETAGELRHLCDNLHSTMLLEIPAPRMECDVDINAITIFERDYGFASSRRHTLGSEDIEVLSKTLALSLALNRV